MTDDSAIAQTLLALLASRVPPATLCPSEVAGALAPHDEAAWRSLMPAVRRVAAGLLAEGRLRVTRGGVEVDAESPGGPVRLGHPVPDGAGGAPAKPGPGAAGRLAPKKKPARGGP